MTITNAVNTLAKENATEDEREKIRFFLKMLAFNTHTLQLAPLKQLNLQEIESLIALRPGENMSSPLIARLALPEEGLTDDVTLWTEEQITTLRPRQIKKLTGGQVTQLSLRQLSLLDNEQVEELLDSRESLLLSLELRIKFFLAKLLFEKESTSTVV
ncbi:MAG: hypothetical protein HQ564_08645 [Candidatus Saganbacteria bacterium]|nr:hypothetical protein [Candidatus Saganbacteria bacterium]